MYLSKVTNICTSLHSTTVHEGESGLSPSVPPLETTWLQECVCVCVFSIALGGFLPHIHFLWSRFTSCSGAGRGNLVGGGSLDTERGSHYSCWRNSADHGHEYLLLCIIQQIHLMNPVTELSTFYHYFLIILMHRMRSLVALARWNDHERSCF